MNCWYTIILLCLLGSCSNSEHKSKFDEMKEDLESAAKTYCECMAKADTTTEHATEVCQKILNEELLDKCQGNEIARDFVQNEIKKCVRQRRGDDE